MISLASAVLRSLIVPAMAGLMLLGVFYGGNLSLRSKPPDSLLTLWVWDTPDDLRFLKDKSTAVAYYAGTIKMRQGTVCFYPCHKPLVVPTGQHLCPVFRIENSSTGAPPNGAADQVIKILTTYLDTSANVDHCVQIDYDASSCERPFYRYLLAKLRRNLPSGTHIVITALASWALADRWLPAGAADEAVIMLFSMGNTDQILDTIGKKQLSVSTSIETSIGISVNEPLTNDRLSRLGIIQKAHRLYLFNSFPWSCGGYLEATRLIHINP